MKNSRKNIYLIALLAIVLLVVHGFITTRIYNGYLLKENALVALNTDQENTVSVTKNSEFVSLESGSVFQLNANGLADNEIKTISVAVPINRLSPNTEYRTNVSFKMHTNSKAPVGIKSNSQITAEQTSFETDINYKPISINNGSPEYVVELQFNTNEEGVGYVIFDFNAEDLSDLEVILSGVIFRDFKEIKDDNITTEQTSEEIIEII